MKPMLGPLIWLYRRTPGLLTLIPLLILWEIVGRLELIFVLPPLTEVAAAGWELIASGAIADNAGGTLYALLVGLGISVVFGVGLGIAMARSRLVDDVLGVYVDVLMSAPVSAIVPILVLIFGTGGQTIIAAVVLFCFFVITVNTYSGVKEVDAQLIEMGRSFSASEGLLLRRVILPGALPLMLTGLRMGVGRSVNGAIFGEMLVSVVGLGGLLILYGSRFQFDRLDALILMIVGTAVILMTFFEWLERRLLAGRFEAADDRAAL
jgi:NitT/TauT family transport system permease protein